MLYDKVTEEASEAKVFDPCEYMYIYAYIYIYVQCKLQFIYIYIRYIAMLAYEPMCFCICERICEKGPFGAMLTY